MERATRERAARKRRRSAARERRRSAARKRRRSAAKERRRVERAAIEMTEERCESEATHRVSGRAVEEEVRRIEIGNCQRSDLLLGKSPKRR